MPQATVRCLQYAIGAGRRRQPRSPVPGAYPPGLVSIPAYIEQPPNTFVTGTAFTAPYPPPQFPLTGSGPTVLHFAFQSVTGLIEGGKSSTDLNNPCQGTVGSSPINVLNVYIPFGGGTGPGGENGAIIDAFNEETGSFCDDTFVTVSPDASGELTNSGNVYGWVASAATETIHALPHISPSAIYFHAWEIIEGTGNATDSVSGADLTVGKKTNPYAFAFYGVRHKEHMKDFKDLKEAKDKENYKDNLQGEKIQQADNFAGKVPYDNLKRIGDVIDQGGGDVVNPATQVILEQFKDKISSLENQISKMGKTFIKVQERPAVGKEIAKKGKKLK